MAEEARLSAVPLHTGCIVKFVEGNVEERIRFFDLGFSPSSVIIPLYKGVYGETTAFWVKGTLIALRKEEADKILINQILREDENER